MTSPRMSRTAPSSVAVYTIVSSEGPDDMPAHVKTMPTATSPQVPVQGGKLMLGNWQAIYLIEHRERAHRCEVVLQFIGSARCNETGRGAIRGR
jgi:secondary thiamine-phosphate synthase enzyme